MVVGRCLVILDLPLKRVDNIFVLCALVFRHGNTIGYAQAVGSGCILLGLAEGFLKLRNRGQQTVLRNLHALHCTVVLGLPGCDLGL
jgi:hypothetical protein